MYYTRSNAGTPQGPVGGGSTIFITSHQRDLSRQGIWSDSGLKCIGCERGEMGCLGWGTWGLKFLWVVPEEWAVTDGVWISREGWDFMTCWDVRAWRGAAEDKESGVLKRALDWSQAGVQLCASGHITLPLWALVSSPLKEVVSLSDPTVLTAWAVACVGRVCVNEDTVTPQTDTQKGGPAA